VVDRGGNRTTSESIDSLGRAGSTLHKKYLSCRKNDKTKGTIFDRGKTEKLFRR